MVITFVAQAHIDDGDQAVRPARVELHHGDFREAGIKPESIDLILTDPPYGKEYMPLWGALGELGRRVLVPGGWLIAYAGQAHLDEEMAGLSKGLVYYWALSLQLRQKQQVRAVRVGWKPILIYFKPPRAAHRFLLDVLSGPGQDKRFHRWGQGAGEMVPLIEKFSREGGEVLDPMAGGGATVEACIEARRNVMAYEIDGMTFKRLEARFAADRKGRERKML